uniref:Nucleoporin NSP1-like C-terminal domain-containing protein n=1 Tax=Strongyloides stercoralis TaxID=6248 RepID=A0AAF5CX10_STRER
MSIFGSAQKPATGTTGSLFGTSSTPNTGSLFGSATSNTPGGSLIGNTPTQTNTGSLFGSTTPTATGGSLFGSSTSKTGTSLFGATPTANSGGSLFGTTSTSTAGSSLFGANTGSFLFGTKTTAASGGSLFGSTTTTTATGGSLFGATTTTATGGSLFGTTTSTAGGSLFGTSTTAPATGTSLFGSTTTATSTAGSSLFGTTAAPTAGSSLFGSTPATGGSSLFGTTPAAGSSLFGTSNTTTGSTLFGSTAKPATGSLFGSTPGTANSLFSGSTAVFPTTDTKVEKPKDENPLDGEVPKPLVDQFDMLSKKLKENQNLITEYSLNSAEKCLQTDGKLESLKSMMDEERKNMIEFTNKFTTLRESSHKDYLMAEMVNKLQASLDNGTTSGAQECRNYIMSLVSEYTQCIQKYNERINEIYRLIEEALSNNEEKKITENELYENLGKFDQHMRSLSFKVSQIEDDMQSIKMAFMDSQRQKYGRFVQNPFDF